MESFMTAAVAYPTAVYTVLLGVVLVYWVLAVLGMVDFESSGIDVDINTHADGDASDLGTLAGYVVAMGLNGVPFSIVISSLVLVAWTVCCLAGMWLLPWVPTMLLHVIASTVVLVFSALVAIPATAVAIRPLRGLFVSHSAISNAALVGQICRVLTGTVTEKDGRAEIARLGATLNIRVWAPVPNALTRGASALILEYDEALGRYLIAPHDPSV